MKTREDVIKFCEFVMKQAQEFVVGGGASPVAFIINDGTVIGTPLDELPSKDAWGPYLQLVKEMSGGHTIIFVTEGWTVLGEDDATKEYMKTIGTDDYIQPSEHPNRVEILHVTAKSDKYKDYSQAVEIVREGSNITFKPIVQFDSEESGDKLQMYCRFTDGEIPTEAERAAMH
jgi:hypothetical protein